MKNSSFMKKEEVLNRLVKLENEIDNLEKKFMNVMDEERNVLVSENRKQIEKIQTEIRMVMPRNISLKKKNYERRMFISKVV